MEPYRALSYFPSTPKEGCVRQARHPLWVLQGTFAPAKKILLSEKTKRGNGAKIMAVTDASGLPVAAHVESVLPHEIRLVEAIIESRFVVQPGCAIILSRYF
jgi:hypothetical protein